MSKEPTLLERKAYKHVRKFVILNETAGTKYTKIYTIINSDEVIAKYKERLNQLKELNG